MAEVTGVIEAVSSKDVNTRFGTKPTYSFKVSGQWYKTGFKKMPHGEGETVSFPFSEGKYGNEVDPAKVKAVSATGGSAAPAAPKSTTAAFSRPFPIPALSGERAIVRQNALTNAREVLQWLWTDAKVVDRDEVAEEIIRLARRFELYTTGDEDAAIAAEGANEKD